MANAVLPSHVSVHTQVLLSPCARSTNLSASFSARSRRQAPSPVPCSPTCSSLQPGRDHPHTSEMSSRCGRRTLLQQAAAGFLWLPAAQALHPSPAQAVAADVAAPPDSAPATLYEPFQGKAGFSLQRPTNKGWVTAFVRSPRSSRARFLARIIVQARCCARRSLSDHPTVTGWIRAFVSST